MYKEEMSDGKQKKTVMLGAFAILVICFGIMWFTANKTSAVGIQVGALAGCMISVFLVLRYALRKYTYGVDEENLTLLLQQGSKLPVITEIPLAEIEGIEKLSERLPRDRYDVLSDYCYSYREEFPKYCVFYTESGKKQAVVFQPSEKMLQEIDKRRTGKKQ